MKTKLLLIAVVAAIAWLSNPAQAQEKGATRLMKLSTLQDIQQVDKGDSIVMSCPKCKDTYVTVVSKPVKGMRDSEVKSVLKHLCPNCATTIKTKGMGKNAKNVLVHTCNSCGSEDVYCCVIKKDGSPTTGMEEKK